MSDGDEKRGDLRVVGYRIIEKARKDFIDLSINEADYARRMTRGWGKVAAFHTTSIEENP